MTDQIEKVKSLIGRHEDFPKPGIIFRDIFPVLADPVATKILMGLMEEKIKSAASEIDIIVALESRGFLLGTYLAVILGKSFVPIRKKGKLPGDVKRTTYKLEYGEDCIEVQADKIHAGQKIVIVDDLIATGGTMKAACDLIASMGGSVVLCLVCIELLELGGRKHLTVPFDTIVSF